MPLGIALGILLGAADGMLEGSPDGAPVADTPIIAVVPAASKIIIHRTKLLLMFAFFVFYENARSFSCCGGHVTLTLLISDVRFSHHGAYLCSLPRWRFSRCSFVPHLDIVPNTGPL